MSRSQAALSGAAGDGKDHDLQYWLDSGFLTLPKNGVDVASAAPVQPPAESGSRPGPRPATRNAPST